MGHSLQILLTSRMARSSLLLCCLVAPFAVSLPQLQEREELVVGSACQLEAIDSNGLVDEERVAECNRCWPQLALEDRDSTEAAKECVRKFLAALQLQEGGPRVDLGKSSAGGEPSQLLPCHRQPVQLSCQQEWPSEKKAVNHR